MNITDIAKIAYEASRAYNQQVFGDFSQQPFDKLAAPAKAEIEARVLFCVENRGAPASSAHDRWMVTLLHDGWRLAEFTDVKQKCHRRLLPWSLLPREEQQRDVLFTRIVAALMESL